MSARPQEPGARSPIRLAGLLFEATAVQALASMAVMILPAIAPKVAQAFGVPTSQIGYQISLVYAAATASSLIAGAIIRRVGPYRAGRLAMVVTAIGCLLESAPHPLALALGSVSIGLAYGLPNPAASILLTRRVPARQRNLVFSIKQTGVPLGGMGAGLIAPPVALALGWRAALWVVAAGCLSVAAGSLLLGEDDEPDRSPSALEIRPRWTEGLRTVVRERPIRLLALSSLCFSSVQFCAVAFLVTLLVEEVKLDLVTAGIVLAAVQVAGVTGRIVLGVIADRTGGLTALLAIALIMAAASALVVTVSPAWPLPFVAALFVVLGLSAVGWNGVFLSEIARLSPSGEVGTITGAALFVTFSGVVIGPAVFATIHRFVHLYTLSYAMLVPVALTGALLVHSVRRRTRASA